MKEVFAKSLFPKAPGGNLYHWKEADTSFDVEKDGKYLISITASAKNAKQNGSHDDDDLRISLDNYAFGKYEIHDGKSSWKGFGKASLWDGSRLKGGDKTIYFFTELKKGSHGVRFYADGIPTIKNVIVFRLNKGAKIELPKQKPPQNFDVDSSGIPWMSFIFLGVKPKDIFITSTVKSATQKNSTDGDNVKVVINGKILQNKKMPTSRKYKNFYFSGDLNKGESETLKIAPAEFEFLENSFEIWYDEKPEVSITISLFDRVQLWLNNSFSKKQRLQFYENTLYTLMAIFSLNHYEHSRSFLKNSLSKNTKKLLFKNNSPIVKKIKRDTAYQKILSIIKNQIKNGNLNGQIFLGDEKKGLEIHFEENDLQFSLHGIKKLEFTATHTINNIYIINITLFDVYDFDPGKYGFYPAWIPVHMADVLEKNLILKNFEIEIRISDKIIIYDV